MKEETEVNGRNEGKKEGKVILEIKELNKQNEL